MSESSTPNELVIQILHQINSSLVTMAERMQGNEQTTSEVLQRLVSVEERIANTEKIEARIEKVETNLSTRLNNHSDRLQTVEARAHKQDGALGAVEWLNKLWPLFAAAIGLIGIYVGFAPK